MLIEKMAFRVVSDLLLLCLLQILVGQLYIQTILLLTSLFNSLLYLCVRKIDFLLNRILISSSFIFRTISTEYMAHRIGGFSDRSLSMETYPIMKTQYYTRICLDSANKSVNPPLWEKLRVNRNRWRIYSNLKTIEMEIRRST